MSYEYCRRTTHNIIIAFVPLICLAYIIFVIFHFLDKRKYIEAYTKNPYDHNVTAQEAFSKTPMGIFFPIVTWFVAVVITIMSMFYCVSCCFNIINRNHCHNTDSDPVNECGHELEEHSNMLSEYNKLTFSGSECKGAFAQTNKVENKSSKTESSKPTFV